MSCVSELLPTPPRRPSDLAFLKFQRRRATTLESKRNAEAELRPHRNHEVQQCHIPAGESRLGRLAFGLCAWAQNTRTQGPWRRPLLLQLGLWPLTPQHLVLGALRTSRTDRCPSSLLSTRPGKQQAHSSCTEITLRYMSAHVCSARTLHPGHRKSEQSRWSSAYR